MITEQELAPSAVQVAGQYLLGELDSLVEQITERVWQVPEYSDILIDRFALEQQVRPNILDTLEFMRSGREIDDEDRARLDELGRSRALQGVPMSAMVQSFRTAERVLIDAFCVFCIRSAFNSAQLRSGIQAISAILDKVETATFDSYVLTQRMLQQEHASSTAVLISRLVDGSAHDRVDVDAQARLVGANPALPYRCVAFAMLARPAPDEVDPDAVARWDASDPTPRLTRLRRHIVARLVEARVPTPVAGVYGNALVMLIPVGRRDALATIEHAIGQGQYRVRADVVGGVGDAYPNLFEARTSCQQALAALDVGLRLRRGRRLVPYSDTVVDVMLLGNRDASERLISGYLTPLVSHPQLDETVRAFIELGRSGQATAERLIVHVNTIAYRLRRVRELTGYDIRDPSVAVNFSLALRARDLLGDSSVGGQRTHERI